MSEFAKPAGLGAVIPSSPAQGVTIGSNDQLVLDYVIGKTIIGGSQFSDVLGNFFPIVIDRTGITVNSNPTPSTRTIFRFHNTASVTTDEIIELTATGTALGISPDSATSVNNALIITDRTGSTYLGWIMYPALTSGTTHPEIAISDPPGTGTVLVFNGILYNNLVTNGAEYLQIAGAVSGSPPAITAFGTDAAVDVRLFPKGAGLVDFAIGSTALGGGAGATLGTIGGSGPTAASQAYWIALKISGTKVWFPVWI